jgi:hypothetical protein
MAKKNTEDKTVLEQEVEAIEEQKDQEHGLDWLAKNDPAALMKMTKIVHLPRATGKQENFLFVSLNGKNYQIQRGVNVEVPLPVAEIIEEAQRAEDRAAAYADALHNE